MKKNNYLNKKIIQEFTDLIAFKTSKNYPQDNFIKCADFLSSLIKQIGFKTKTINKKNKPIILAELERVKNKNYTTILIYGHYDVQDTGDINLWKHNPYELRIKDGYFYGRGVCDSKGNIIANLYAIKQLLEQKNILNIKIKILIEGEEEIGSPYLIKNINKLRIFLKDVDLCIFPGESSVKDSEENIIVPTGYKGCLIFKINFFNKKNKSYHSGFGRIVENPAFFLMDFLTYFKKEFDNLKIVETKNKLVTLSKEEIRNIKLIPYKFENKTLTNNLKKELFLKPVFNIIDFYTSNTKSENKLKTTIPNNAEAVVDIRLIPYLKTDYISQLIKKFLDNFFKQKKINFLDYKLINLASLECGYSNFDKKTITKIKKIFELTYVNKKVYFLPISPGSGPQYYLCTQFGIPVIVAGVGYYKSNIHAPNENIKIKDFIDHMNFIKNFIMFFCKK